MGDAADQAVELASAALRERGLVEPVQFTDDVGSAETVAAIALVGAGHDQMEAVVRDLAATEPSCWRGGVPFCDLCNGVLDDPSPEPNHAATCPYRRARELFKD